MSLWHGRTGRAVSAVVLVVALVTTAGAAGALAKSRITVFGWGNAQEMQNRRAQTEAFMQANPDVEVQLEITPPGPEWERKLDTTLAAGTAADVIMMSADWHGNRGRRGVFQDLQPFVRKDGLDAAAILLPGIDSGYVWPNGLREGMPITGASLVVAFNKDLFDDAGLPYPSKGWTWEDYLSYARKLTRGEGLQKVYGAADHWAIATLSPHIFGGRIFNEDHSKVLADDPKVAQGIQFFLDMMKLHKVMPDAAASQGMPSDQRFYAGKAGMIFMATWDIPTFQQSIGKRFAWDVAPMPADPRTGKPVTLIWTTGYAINARARDKDAAWRYVKFMSTDRRASEIAARIAIPSVKDVAYTTFVKQTQPGWTPINLKAFVDSFAFGILNPMGGFYAKINDAYDRTWQAIYLGKADPVSAMKEFAGKAREILPTLK
ncbi:MAG: sugar ABC transporter substrate-binding protein [Bacillota bacterium]